MRSNHLPPGPEPEREPPSDDGANALPSAAEPSPEAVLAAATASGTTRRRRSPAAALLVALGILLTRLFGLVRARVQAQYLGTSIAADALTAATRIPNLLQNLFGEGALSASFIPVYARLLAGGDAARAGRVAGAVLGLLSAVVTVIVALGVLATPLVVDTLAPGFAGEKRALTVLLVRILFPGTGLLVLSAWCLGVLNSHRRFFLSYTAPVVWNVAIIGALLWGGVHRMPGARLVEFVAWWTVVGSALQFVVQLPTVFALTRGVRPSLSLGSADVREIVRNFVPAFVSRGVVQISGYVDLSFSSLLGNGVQAAMGYAQQLYLLPVGLFGMSVSAAELPELSRATGDPATAYPKLRQRLDAALRQVAFFVVPSTVAFIALGDVVVGVVLESGAFRREQSDFVWAVLAGSAVGLLATTLGRLYSSTYFALGDTRTPLRFALVRIALSIALGWALAFPVRRALGVAAPWGAAGLTAASGLAGWVEYLLLRGRLGARIGRTGLPVALLGRLWLGAAVAAAAGWGVKLALGRRHALLAGIAVLGVYGAVYGAATLALRVPEATRLLGRVLRRRAPNPGAASQ